MTAQTTMPMLNKRHYWALVHVFNMAFPGPSGYEERARLYNVCDPLFRKDNVNYDGVKFAHALHLDD